MKGIPVWLRANNQMKQRAIPINHYRTPRVWETTKTEGEIVEPYDEQKVPSIGRLDWPK